MEEGRRWTRIGKCIYTEMDQVDEGRWRVFLVAWASRPRIGGCIDKPPLHTLRDSKGFLVHLYMRGRDALATKSRVHLRACHGGGAADGHGLGSVYTQRWIRWMREGGGCFWWHWRLAHALVDV